MIIIIENYLFLISVLTQEVWNASCMYTIYLSLYILKRIHRLVLSIQYVCTFDICEHGNIERDVFLDKYEVPCSRKSITHMSCAKAMNFTVGWH